MLAMARGFQATLVSSGSPSNAIVRRAGATSEMDSSVEVEDVRILEVASGVGRSGAGSLVSPEVVVVASFPLKTTGTDANVQVRGMSPRALEVRPSVRLSAGRFFQPGLPELALGRNVVATYAGFEVGMPVRFGGETWTVVGTFDAGGSAFDSELWCDAAVLKRVYQRPLGNFQSVTVRLESPESFGALNTMYSAVAERTREIATMRALGFPSLSVIASFMVESLLIAFIGGVVGCIAGLPVNGLTTGTMNWQTFSHLAFAFRITPALLGFGVAFALLMGLLGGVPPAVRAARLPVAAALRDL